MSKTQIEKDRATLEAMGRIFCKAHHDGPKDHAGLCASCRESVDVTLSHTVACPYGHTQNCQDCTIHCQRDENRARIRQIMSYAAPRMTFRHPLMTAGYLRKKLSKS